MANSEDESIFNDKYFEEVQSIEDFKFRVVSYNVSKVQIHLNNSKLSSQESIFGDKINESYSNPKHRADIYDISLLTKGKRWSWITGDDLERTRLRDFRGRKHKWTLIECKE